MRIPDWTAISGYWNAHRGEIMLAGASAWGVDPYAWDHDIGIVMTRIEAALWCDIRAVGAVLYPQWPVAGYFVDFGNPAAKVAIECDGRAYHKDAARDASRQARIEREGWKVYRITGADCFTDEHEQEDELGFMRTVQGRSYRFIKEIAERHGIRIGTRKRAFAERKSA